MAIDNLVKATLTYYTPPKDGSKPWSNIHATAETGIKERNYEEAPFDMMIENVRGNEDKYSLDSSGFAWHKIPTKMTAEDFQDDEKIKSVYYEEQAENLKKVTGASKVYLFDHTIRRTQPGVKLETPSNRHPVTYVHVDQTNESAIARVHRHLPEEADQLLKGRYQLINLWRPIRHEAYDRPLALCDYQSVSKEDGGDLVPTLLKYPDGKTGEISNVLHRDGHKWKYVKGMTPEEFVLIKCYDSKQDGSVAVFTPHTSFQDPSTPADAKPRESIELRALVFY